MAINPAKGKLRAAGRGPSARGLAKPGASDHDSTDLACRGEPDMRISSWGLGLVVLCALGVPALAHHSKYCRPYTIEKICNENRRPCHLHMVYAPGHNPAGAIPDGYWYSAKPKTQAWKHKRHKTAHGLKRHAKRPSSVYATCKSFTCWFQHDPEHRY
jgi:hypothetical protein